MTCADSSTCPAVQPISGKLPGRGKVHVPGGLSILRLLQPLREALPILPDRHLLAQVTSAVHVVPMQSLYLIQAMRPRLLSRVVDGPQVWRRLQSHVIVAISEASGAEHYDQQPVLHHGTRGGVACRVLVQLDGVLQAEGEFRGSPCLLHVFSSQAQGVGNGSISPQALQYQCDVCASYPAHLFMHACSCLPHCILSGL